MKDLPEQALNDIASYFQALSDPTRLKILNLLRDRPHNVGELAQLTGYSAANVSRHLAQMAQRGIVSRESRGTSAFYRIADETIYALCDLVCGNIARHHERLAPARALMSATFTEKSHHPQGESHHEYVRA